MSDDQRPFNLDEFITKWRMKHGVLTKSRKWEADYYMIPVSQRFELFKILVEELRKVGKSRDWFTNTIKDNIVKLCIPVKKSVTAESYNGFLTGTQRHLNEAIIAVFDAAELAKSTENEMPDFVPDPEKDKDIVRDTLDPEMAELLGLK
jgi:hypothetical protein